MLRVTLESNEIGKGAHGIVYKAIWRNAQCVVKTLIGESSDHGFLTF